MRSWLRGVLSPEAGPFWQFVKYGAVGVASTAVQLVVFLALAATCLKCLTPDDWAVRFLGLQSACFDGSEPWFSSRWFLAAVATAVGFTVANVFCWLLNRAIVFRAGRFSWYVEFAMFYCLAAFATAVALAVQSVLIRYFGLMTSAATLIEVLVSFAVNFFIRKFYIFGG